MNNEPMTNIQYPIANSQAPALTVEKAAYLAVGLLAAALRFYQLGLRPLSESEAVQALAALRFTQGAVPAAPAGTVPALFTGNVASFSLLGAGDITARWLPVLAGVILALLPYGLRRRLGRGGALAASLLLALSPSAVYFSRSLESAILVAACGLALVVGLVNYVDARQPRSLLLAGVALGLGLVSGAGTYTLLLVFAVFALVLYLARRLLDRETGWSALLEAWAAARSEKDLLAQAGAALAATFGLAAMTFVLHPAGVGHAADLIGAWARSFLPAPGGQPLVYPLLLLLRYEPLILLLGLVEVGRWARARNGAGKTTASAFPLIALLVFWAGAALVLTLISGQRPAGNVLLVVVPLALLAGPGVERAWRWIERRTRWAEAGLFAAAALGLAVFFYLWMATYSRTGSTSTVSLGSMTLYATTSYLLLASVALLLVVGLGAIAWIWRGPELVVAGGWLAALVILGLFGFRATWGLNVTHAADPRELMIGQTSAPDVRLLVDRLEALSLARAGDAHTLPVTVAADTGPVVAWYLRDFDHLSLVENLTAPPDTVAAVTLAARDLPIGETFQGQGFPLRAHWSPWGLWGQDLVRWLLFTDAGLPTVDQEIVLWVVGGGDRASGSREPGADTQAMIPGP